MLVISLFGDLIQAYNTTNLVHFYKLKTEIAGFIGPITIREGVKKTFFWDFVPNYGKVGIQSPKLFSESNHSVILKKRFF